MRCSRRGSTVCCPSGRCSLRRDPRAPGSSPAGRSRTSRSSPAQPRGSRCRKRCCASRGGAGGRSSTPTHLRPPARNRCPTGSGACAASLRPISEGVVRILLGDFNATLDHQALRDVLDRGYVDAADAVGKALTPTWPRQRLLPPTVTIDHVLVDERVRVSDVGIHELPGLGPSRGHRGSRAAVTRRPTTRRRVSGIRRPPAEPSGRRPAQPISRPAHPVVRKLATMLYDKAKIQVGGRARRERLRELSARSPRPARRARWRRRRSRGGRGARLRSLAPGSFVASPGPPFPRRPRRSRERRPAPRRSWRGRGPAGRARHPGRGSRGEPLRPRAPWTARRSSRRAARAVTATSGSPTPPARPRGSPRRASRASRGGSSCG